VPKERALNTQEEDQEGTSAERRNQEGPEGSNTPKQTRATGYKLSIRCQYCSTSHSSGDADDEREDGRHDERPQRIGVKRP